MAAAMLPHDWNGFGATIAHTGKVCLNRSIPFLGRELANRLENANTCVVHQDIEPPEACRRMLDHAAAVLVAADISDRSSRAVFARRLWRRPSAVFSVVGLRPQINTLA